MDLRQELSDAIDGEVKFDEMTRRAYSVDASIFEILPMGVVIPKSISDLIAIMKIAEKHEIPVIPRGAATGITGGCLGPGIIIDLSKYLKSIIEIDYENEYAICEPGVVQDDLNAALSSHGYRLGPDTSTGNRATIGGMLANNAAGARSLRYGKMVDHIEEVALVLSGGELIELKLRSEKEQERISSQNTREGIIYRATKKIRREYAGDIAERFPNIPRRVSGYNLDELIKSGEFNPAKLIAGSEGTLGIVVRMKLKISKRPKVTALCVMHCNELLHPMRYIPSMLEHRLLSLEMIDAKILAAGRGHPAMRGKLKWLQGNPQAIYIAEMEGEDAQAILTKLKIFKHEMEKRDFAYSLAEITENDEMNAVRELRKAGLGLLLSKRAYSRAIAFIEDISVAPEELFSFMTDFLKCLKAFGKEAGIYGHAGSGCLHIRPYVDLRNPDEQKKMEEMMKSVSDLLLKHRGALSGEHGDGYIRSWLNEKMFGKRVYEAFCELKHAFDPKNLLNPGKIVDARPPLHDLRSETTSNVQPIKTFLNFSEEGGIELAVDLCNGNGLCRKKEGVMCPSFQATGDEYDTTRARAQALRAIVHGNVPRSLDSQEVHDILDLCIQCKGCRTECPSQVDMAKMKSEALYRYHLKRRYPLRSLIFGNIARINALLSPIAGIADRFSRSGLGKWLLNLIGIAKQRTLPAPAKKRFTDTFKDNSIVANTNSKKVVLFCDTFTEFNHPEIGQAAVKVLESLGYSIIVPPLSCCGRTLFSKGMLEEAKVNALKLIAGLTPYALQGIPIIVLEPGCASMLKEDIESLIAGNENYSAIRKLTTSFDAFVHRHLIDGKWPGRLSPGFALSVLFHGHCHQKAYEGTSLSEEVLRSLGYDVKSIESGCCGMAGAFGFEKEHYAISMKIGSLKLFPAIDAAPGTTVVANGVSCRQQILDGTSRKALHLAELIASRIE